MVNETQSNVVRGFVPWNEMADVYEDAIRRVVDLLRELPVEAGDRPVPGMEWTAAETAAHLIGILGRGLGDWRRGDTLKAMHELNAQCLEEVDTRDIHEVADRIESGGQEVARLRHVVRGDEPFPLHAGVVAESAAAVSYGCWDFLVHGFDIATATGARWEIPPASASRVLRAGLPAIRPWVEPEVLTGPRQGLVVGFAEDESAVALTVGESQYQAELVGAEQADAILDPAHTLLAVSGRVPAGDPLVKRLASWYLPI